MNFSDRVRAAWVTAACHHVGVHLRQPTTFSSAKRGMAL